MFKVTVDLMQALFVGSSYVEMVKGKPYVLYDTIVVENPACGRATVVFLKDGVRVCTLEVPRVDPGCTLTLSSLEGRAPLQVDP